jgi:phospholipid-transporting ATPase
MIFLPIYATVAPLLGFSEEYAGILPFLYPTIVFWASIIVIPVMCLIRDFAWK